MELIEISLSGEPERPVSDLSARALEVLACMPAFYAREGHQPPWVGYLAVEAGICVGTCAFKAPPAHGRVEIAYFTFPGREGQGVATRMTQALVALARAAAPEMRLCARTLSAEGPSTRVLRKNGFMPVGEVDDPEDGRVLEWELIGASE